MLTIFLLLAAHPVLFCGADRLCMTANQFRGRYSEWAEVVTRIPPGGIDARERQRWNSVMKAFKRLETARREIGW